ncbi:MAG: twin-arginine translocase TatA/TatE family subunit [Peptococcaceae bacterium]|nr:twin-arginine translocase TatA/TatE family subunit [Peptococcaceae bacterium]
MNLGPTELILILGVALVIFGPGKLPELGQTLGKTIREFKGAINNIDEDIKKDLGDIKTEVQEVKDAVDVRATINDLKKDVKDAVRIDLPVSETAKEAPEQAADSAAEQK